MTIVYDMLMALDIAPVDQFYDAKDCMLYALGVGLGHDPTNEDELAFVYEKNFKVLPTMATIIGHSAALVRNPISGINWLMVVNGEQGFTLQRPLAGEDAIIGTHPDRRRDRQRRRQGRATPDGTYDNRQGERGADRAL